MNYDNLFIQKRLNTKEEECKAMDDKNQQYYEYLKDKYSESYGDNEPQCLRDIYAKKEKCPDITTLRDILLVYKENNVRVGVISENSYLNSAVANGRIPVKDIDKDFVYLGSSEGYEAIIPINKIKFIVAYASDEVSQCIESIINKGAKKNKNDALNVLADKIKESMDKRMYIETGDMGEVYVCPEALRSHAWFTICAYQSIKNLWIIVFPFARIITVSNEMVFVGTPQSSTQFLIPVNAITGVIRQPKQKQTNTIIDSDEKFNIFNDKNNLNNSIIILDKDGKSINLSEIGIDIKGKSIEEIMHIVDNIIE